MLFQSRAGFTDLSGDAIPIIICFLPYLLCHFLIRELQVNENEFHSLPRDVAKPATGITQRGF